MKCFLIDGASSAGSTGRMRGLLGTRCRAASTRLLSISPRPCWRSAPWRTCRHRVESPEAAAGRSGHFSKSSNNGSTTRSGEAGRLSAIIDWGTAGYADPAQDLAPAWAVLDGHSRDIFRQAVDADEATWIRARTFELQHAVAGVLYYIPRRHPLGDVMARTLDRILEQR